MADEKKAAFGVFPQMKPRRSRQDPEAAKDVPRQLLRGWAAGTLGLPGDIEGLGRLLANIQAPSEFGIPRSKDQALQMLGEIFGADRVDLTPSLPTSEFYLDYLPGKAQGAAGEAAAGLGTLFGGLGSTKVARGALEAGKAAGKAGRAALETVGAGPSPGGLASQRGVIKMPGGNWMPESVERALRPLKTPVIPNIIGEGETQLSAADAALNKWVEGNLTNYVKKKMATPEDPVRKLAEEGIVHFPSEQVGINRYNAPTRREIYGGEQLGKSQAAKAWEDASDVAIAGQRVGERKELSKQGVYSHLYEPWMDKLDPNEMVYAPMQFHVAEGLGFDHIIDVLREDLATGRIRPEQLSKVSMEQAVRRTYEYDQELAKKMQEANAALRAGLPVYKEYPEKFRWIELNKPGSFASESEAMGHSVRGYEPPKGHPDWVPESGESGSLGYGHGGWEAIKSGKAKVYSLVDEKGQPHVTVEVGRQDPSPVSWLHDQPQDIVDEITAKVGERPTMSQMSKAVMEHPKYQQDAIASTPHISQIKGKQNRAPKAEYLPFVQDFVKSGKWSDVGDITNANLEKTDWTIKPQEIEKLKLMGIDVPEYLTPDERLNLVQKLKGEPTEGMKRGGKVRFTDNPDAMRLELSIGGLSRLAKSAKSAPPKPKPLERAPAKSKEEIRAIAERVAPQMTGEYVRGKGAQTIAGKTQKQFQREKSLQHDIRPTGQAMPEPETVNIESQKDKVMIGIPGDPTITGQTVYRVGDVPLESPAPQHGGPLYGQGREDQAFWASGISPASRVQNLADEVFEQYGGRDVLGNYIMMTPDSLNYAQHFADANLQAIDLSKMTKQQIEQFNELIRRGNAKSGPRPSFPGIEDKGAAYLHFSIDPKLRIHFNELMQMPRVTERLNLPSGADIAHAITEPSLRDLERGVTGKSIGRMIPGGKLTLSEHPTYSHDIPGEFMGSSKYPMPYELTFPDTLKAVRENPEQAPQEFGSLKMVGPRQIIDQQLIDEIRQYEEMIKALTGKAEGGAVEMAGGGTMSKVAMEAIAKLKLLREEAAAKAAQQAQYAKEMEGLATRDMPTFEQWKSVQDKKGYAAGGEITADDLIIEERPL